MLRVLAVFAVFSLVMSWPHSTIAQQRAAVPAPSTVRNDLSDKTVRFTSEKYGSGVLYFAQDGRTFLWNPGRIEVQIGTWFGETIEIKSGPENTVTLIDVIWVTFPGNFNGQGHLFAALDANRIYEDLGVKEVSDGDVLALEDGEPPCRTCHADMTFSQMLGT